MKTIFTLALVLFVNTRLNQKPEGWEIFDKVIFKPKYFEEVGAYFEVPTFNKELLALENSEVMLSGYYIPLEIDSMFMLSALPFSSCFFCGGAGPESIAEIQFKEFPKQLEPDEFVKIKGRLKLNELDIDHMNFILQEAKLIK